MNKGLFKNKKELERLLKLSDIKPMNEGRISNGSLELVKKGPNDVSYGIVRENKKHYIKTSLKKGLLNESDFDYIGGLQNKPKFSFDTYQDALQSLNLIFRDLNETYGVKEMNNMLVSDDVICEDGQCDDLIDDEISNESYLIPEKRFVIKQKSKKQPVKQDLPVSEPDLDFETETPENDTPEDMGGSDEMDFGGEDTTSDEFTTNDQGDTDNEDMTLDDSGEDSGDSIKSIQKLTGKLGQKLRNTEDMSSDMQKWVAKSVLSALNLDKMDDTDKENIVSTITGGKEEFDENYETVDEDLPSGPGSSSPIDFEDDEEIVDNVVDMDETDSSGPGSSVSIDEDSIYSDYAGFDGLDEDDDMYNFDTYEDYLESKKAKSVADKDMTPEYNKPGYDGHERKTNMSTPSERWSKYKLPYDTKFNHEITEDHLNDEMDTLEQETAYEDVEDMVRHIGFDVKYNKQVGGTKDVEESVVFLDLVNFEDKTVGTVRINSQGKVEIGKMKAGKFVGQPLDNMMDFNEFLGEKNITMENSTETAPAKPVTKPAERERQAPQKPSPWKIDPSRGPKPGEESAPKAKKDELDLDINF